MRANYSIWLASAKKRPLPNWIAARLPLSLINLQRYLHVSGPYNSYSSFRNRCFSTIKSLLSCQAQFAREW